MKTFLLFASLIPLTAHSQVAVKYFSNSPGYFPARLYLLEDARFLYQEDLGKDHDDEYYERGNYKLKADTLFLFTDRCGFSCDQMISEPTIKMGLLDGKRIQLLREDGSKFLELKRQPFRNKKEILNCLD